MSETTETTTTDYCPTCEIPALERTCACCGISATEVACGHNTMTIGAGRTDGSVMWNDFCVDCAEVEVDELTPTQLWNCCVGPLRSPADVVEEAKAEGVSVSDWIEEGVKEALAAGLEDPREAEDLVAELVAELVEIVEEVVDAQELLDDVEAHYKRIN